MMRKAGLLAVVVAVVVAVPAVALAGGGMRQAGACPGFAEGAEVSMLDGCFDGVAHFAAAGAALTIVNDGAAPHTYTAVDGSFDTGTMEAGEEFTLDGIAPGVYRVYCTLHGTASGNGMAGVLVVGDPSPSGAAPIAAPSVGSTAGGDEIVAALDRQTEVLTAIGDRQTALLDGLQPADAGAPPDWAWQVTILLALAAGAGVVALSVGRRSARPAPPQVVGSEVS